MSESRSRFEPVERDSLDAELDGARELTVSVRRYAGATIETALDQVAHEAPLEIQIGGTGIAVVMRTPGHDEELALGFLLSERVIRSPADVVSIHHCTTVPEPEAEGNVIRVVLAEGVAPPLERLRRNTYASSSCGICGKATIAAALEAGGVVCSDRVTRPAALFAMAERLRTAQPGFDLTGGLHAAGLFTVAGELRFAREDVGRHNAVDKVLGAAARAGIPLADHVLFVSGRIGFEIVQKAAACGVPLVAGISAPTSLAVRFGDALGVTVVGFVRGERLNVYSHPDRVV
ncbi:MAG TPA: formate dehydrogenase accessory sulfurtransferase FdhD [Polyangiaceae bacterium]|nr:MAG: formate dehydrogenase accessory sulfurtransferase FdhD [Pseudomonadota bacterium]HLV65000.1 formate dehydrogenase accessory sulfurtransferase FdhD [Polyangiaceae bacterium]